MCLRFVNLNKPGFSPGDTALGHIGSKAHVFGHRNVQSRNLTTDGRRAHVVHGLQAEHGLPCIGGKAFSLVDTLHRSFNNIHSPLGCLFTGGITYWHSTS